MMSSERDRIIAEQAKQYGRRDLLTALFGSYTRVIDTPKGVETVNYEMPQDIARVDLTQGPKHMKDLAIHAQPTDLVVFRPGLLRREPRPTTTVAKLQNPQEVAYVRQPSSGPRRYPL